MVTRESPYPPAGTVQQPPASYAPPQMSQAPNYAGNGGYGNSNGYGGYSGGQQYQPPDQAGGGYGYGGGNQAQEYYQQSQGAGGQKPPPQAPPPQNGAGMEGKFDDVKPKFNDVIFALLFLAQLGAFIAISVISLRALPASEGSVGLGQSGGTATTLNASTAWLLAIISGTALVLSILLLVLVRLFTKIILELCLLLAVAMSIGYAVYMWVERYWSGAIIFTIFAVISILAYPGMRRRIPFSCVASRPSQSRRRDRADSSTRAGKPSSSSSSASPSSIPQSTSSPSSARPSQPPTPPTGPSRSSRSTRSGRRTLREQARAEGRRVPEL